MAATECPDCGSDVPEGAPACPACGCVVKSASQDRLRQAVADEPERARKVTVRPGQGARMAEGKRASDASEEEEARAAPAGARVLIVDDSQTVRRMIANTLTTIHAACEEAGDGTEALRVLRQSLSHGPPFGLVILDLSMPSLGGYRTLEQIRADAALRDMPVVLLSTPSERARVYECAKLGISGYVVKPLNTAKILEAVRVALAVGHSLVPEGGQSAEFLTHDEVLELKRLLADRAAEAVRTGAANVQDPAQEPVFRAFSEFVDSRCGAR